MVKVLVIDDKDDNLISIKLLLNEINPDYIIFTENNGIDGLNRASKELPDVILLDIIMPGIDGFEVCSRLKNDSTLKYIPVILLTAIRTDSKSRIKGLEMGADSYLSKPVEPAELAAQVNAMVRIKKAEDKLLKEKGDLENLVYLKNEDLRLKSKALDAAINAIIITDNKGQIMWCNKAFVYLTGYSMEEVYGQNPRLLKSSQQSDEFYNLMWDEISNGKPWKGEIINKKKDGTLYTEEMTITPILSEFNRISNFIAIKEDITERKEIASRLRHSEKMESIGHLAGGIAHDFNNILSVIIGKSTSTQKLVVENDKASANLNLILDACNRAKHLVQQILTFSKQNPGNIGPIHIKPIIHEVLQMLIEVIPSSISIEQDIDVESHPIDGDISQIHEILMNLCTNADQAMNGKGKLTISLKEKFFLEEFNGIVGNSPAGNYTILSIKDDGKGMDENTLQKAFDPFYTTKLTGTGLGLSVSFNIIKSLGGNIIVKSKLNFGTEFLIFFPQSVTIAPLIEIEHEKNSTSGNERILFIDDELVLCEVAYDMLGDLGYDVVTFNHSQKALDVFKMDPQAFDMIITDQTMPGIRGFELSIEALKIRKDIPIILCTGYSALVDESAALEAGIKSFQLKPWNIEDLATRIRFIFDE